MTAAHAPLVSKTALAIPLAAIMVLAGVWGRQPGTFAAVLVALTLVAAVLSAVHHAEIVAHRVGEPFGTLVLAIAVTVIEVALVLSMMLSGGPATSALPRDTVFAAVMIICNGMIGICLVAGALRHHVLSFRVDGAAPAFAVLATLATMTMVLPAFTTSTPGLTFSVSQLVFAGTMSLLLYGVFVFVQTVRHRDYFLPLDQAEEGFLEPPSTRTAWASLVLLLLCLVAVVGLAKMLSPLIESGVRAANAPPAAVGVIIAMLVLLPETLAATRAALANRMQISLNLALGSGLATIGLTIPAVIVLSLFLDMPLTMGLPQKELALLAITFVVGTLTLSSGRASVLQGAVHLAIFAAFLFLSIVP